MRTYIIGIVAILLLAACSSSRKAAKSVGKDVPVLLWKTDECVTAKANVRIRSGKGKGVTVGGTLRMKRDDVILLNMTYILGIQVGTMEMTQDYVLVVSRYTRQYIRLTYPELSAMLGRAVTFNDMQNIFWGDAKEFQVKSVEWKYGGFATMEDGRRLPEELDIAFSHGATALNMSMTLNNHRYEGGWNTRTSFNAGSYEQLTPEQLKHLVTIIMNN